jgi:flagellin
MRINTNVGALNSAKNSFVNNMMTEGSMRKLSSGLRISRAADDAAGLSIANKLRAQSRSLTVAAANSEQGNAMLQIAEGSASTIQKILERQKELIIQRESTGNNSSVTGTLNTEISTLSSEVDRIISSTNFQGSTVFTSLAFQVSDGTAGGSVSVDATLASSSVSIAGTASISTVDTALTAINTVLASIGAGQNRLDYTVQNLKAAVVNVKAAESTIRDVDMAEEMANYTKNSILTQAAQAMLAQANQSSQSVLSLLR